MTNNINLVSGGAVSRIDRTAAITPDRRHFIGGSDARIIMGKDEKALLRLWREKRGEAAALDLSSVLIVQLAAGHRGPQPPLVRAQFRPPDR